MTEVRSDSRGAIVITGTSTGIGAACAVELAEAGFSVLAGVRSEADAPAVASGASGTITPLIIDIQDPAVIASAVETVAGVVGDRGIAGLVNNAGIVKPGPLEFQPMADLREQFEVNLFGHIAVTQAFLPLIRQGKGRLVNVGSIGGRLVLPLHGAYSASKFAMEAVTDALRLELPGVEHPCLARRSRRQRDCDLRQDARVDRRHGPGPARSRDRPLRRRHRLRTRARGEDREEALPPGRVAKAVTKALTSKRPKTRYLAGKDARAVALMAKTLPDHLKDIAVAHEAHLPDPD